MARNKKSNCRHKSINYFPLTSPHLINVVRFLQSYRGALVYYQRDRTSVKFASLQDLEKSNFLRVFSSGKILILLEGGRIPIFDLVEGITPDS